MAQTRRSSLDTSLNRFTYRLNRHCRESVQTQTAPARRTSKAGKWMQLRREYEMVKRPCQFNLDCNSGTTSWRHKGRDSETSEYALTYQIRPPLARLWNRNDYTRAGL